MSGSPGQEGRSRLAAFADWLTTPSGERAAGTEERRRSGQSGFWRPLPEVPEQEARPDPEAEDAEHVPASSLDVTHVGAVARGPAPSGVEPWDPESRLWRPPPTAGAATPAQRRRPAEAPAPTPAPRTLPPMADTGTPHPARRILAEWPILLVLGGTAFGMSLALGDKDNLLSGTFVMGMTLLLAAALRLFLPTRTAGSLAIRRRAIDVATYTLLGFTVIVLGLLVQGIFGG